MSLKRAFNKVLSSGIDNYNPPKTWNIENTTIFYNPCSNGVSMDEWRNTLEEWMPKFAEVGWLSGFQHISIGPNVLPDSRGVARYYPSDKTISIENDPRADELTNATVSNSVEAVLIHEMIHHAHMEINGHDEPACNGDVSHAMKHEVSRYAGESVYEAVAETGVGIVLGHEYPDQIHEYYEEQDGPQEVYELG